MAYWFVQRMMLQTGHKGPVTERGHLETDYMGSAEFEFGAVSKSFQEMRQMDLGLFPVPIKAFGTETTFHVIAESNHTVEELQSRFQEWIDGGMRGKEYPRLREVVTHRDISNEKLTIDEVRDRYPVAWWEIHENFFWSLDEKISGFWLDYIRTWVDTKAA